jgi:hypothetical protein
LLHTTTDHPNSSTHRGCSCTCSVIRPQGVRSSVGAAISARVAKERAFFPAEGLEIKSKLKHLPLAHSERDRSLGSDPNAPVYLNRAFDV